MLAYIIISVLLNIVLVIIGTTCLSHLTILGLIFISYLFPLILNALLSVLVILKKKLKSLYCLVFPTISLLAYVIMGLFLENSSVWSAFIKHNTMTSGEMYIKINAHLVEPSQIIFVALLYFLVEYLILNILERMVMKNGNH